MMWPRRHGPESAKPRITRAQHADMEAVVAAFNMAQKRYHAAYDVFDEGRQFGIAVHDTAIDIVHAARCSIPGAVSVKDCLQSLMDRFADQQPKQDEAGA